jgi:hypothetical protein
MKTSCVLTEADVKNLYIVAGTVINEAMKNGEVFEPKALMQRVFDLYDKKNDPITGALFVQQLPSIIGIIIYKPSIRGLKIDRTLDLFDLKDKFLNPDTGIDNVFEIFKPQTDPETLKTLIAIQKGIELNDQNEKKPVQRADVRLGAYSPFGLTMQMFEAKKPSEKGEFEIEKIDKSKDRIYNTLFNIKKALPDDFNGMSEAVYEGVTLVLTPAKLTGMNQKEWLDKYSIDRIVKSATFRKKGYGKEGVTEATEMIVMVLTDKATNQFVMFDEDGHIDKTGKPVYQYLRDTRFENGRFRVTDIYGLSDQIITPRQLLDNQIADSELSTEEFEEMLAKQGRTTDELLKELDAEQQEQFKILYGMKQDILGGKMAQYSITGVSNGLNFGYVRKTIPFNELINIPGVSNDVYKTLDIIKSPRDGFGKSQAVVTINDREFAVNRPNMDETIIDKIATILSNPNISDANKFIYVNQFTVNLDPEVQRHKINFNQSSQVISFFYTPYTYDKTILLKAKAQKKAQENNQKVNLDELNKAFAPIKLDLSAADAKDKIKEVLTNAYYDKEKIQSSKMKFEPKLNGKTFLDYNAATGKFVRANYTDFIKQFPADVVFTPENSLGVFNSYIMFRPNTAFTESLNKAKETVDNGLPTAVKSTDVKVNSVLTEEEADWLYDNLKLITKTYNSDYLANSIETELKEPLIIGDTIVTHIEPEAGGKSSIIFERPSGKWMIQISEKNEKKRIDLYQWRDANVKGEFSFYTTNNSTANDLKNIEKAGLLPLIEEIYKDTNVPYPGSRVKAFELSNSLQQKYGLKRSYKDIVNELKPTTQPTTSVETEVPESNIGESSVNFPTVPNVEEGIQPTDTKGPETENTEVGKIFNRFQWDRSAKLPNGVTKEQVQAAQEWWSKSPLSKIISLTQIGNIVNSDSFASFIINGATLADTSININTGIGGTMVDVYHEAWHGFSQLFLTKEEKTKLYNEVKNFKDAKGNQPNIDKSFFELEEMLAEDFRSYILNPKATKGAPTRNSLFRRILNFIKGLFNKNFKREEVAGEVTLVPAVKELYDNLYMASGDPSILNKYKPNVDNAMFSMLDRGVSSVEDKKAEVLNFQDSTELVNSIDSIISDTIDKVYADSVALAAQQNDDKIVSKAGAVKILTDARNKKVAYEMVQEELQKRYNAVLTELETAKTENDAVKVDQLEDVARILKLGLENFGDETKGLVKYHIENSTFDIVRQKFIEIDYADDEENKTVAEEAQTSERYGDKVVNDKSLQELASKETLYILKSLFKKSGKNYVYNKLGFKELADFTTTWNNVTRAIGGIKDRVEMYNELKTAALTFPELQQLLDYKLPDPTKLLDSSEFKISSAFWQDFKKPRITYIQLTAFKEGKGYELEVTEASIEISSVLRKFQNKFKADTDNPYVNRVNNINTLDLQKVAEKFARKDNGEFDSTKAFDFARAIGLYMDELSVIKNELTANKKYYSLEYTFKAIKELAELEKESNIPKNKVTSKQLRAIGDFKLDPVGVLKNGIPAGVISDKEFKQKNIIERFAELQGKYGADSSNFSVLNAERNLVSEHIEDNTVSMIVHGINKAKKLQDLWGTDELQYMSYLNPEVNSFTLRSKILNSIFAIDTNSFEKRDGKSLQLNYVSGTQIAEGSEGANTTSLDVYSKFLQEMHMMLKGGLQEFMRHASKSSSFGVRVEGDIIGGMGKGEDGHLYIDIDMFAPNGNAEQYSIDEFFIDYMDAELERIQKFNNNIDTYKNYVGYNRVLEYDSNGDPKVYAGQVFTAFDNVLTDDTKEFIYNNIKTGTIKDYIETNPDFKEILSNEVKNYFDGQTVKNENYLNEVNYVDPKLLNILTAIGMSKVDAKTALVKAFTYNSWIHNFETASLMYGDIVQYNHAKEEMHKRNTGSTSGGRGFLTDVYARKFINGFVKNTSYANTLSKLPQFGNSVLNWNYDGTFNTAILRDINRKSVYRDQIRKGLTADYTRRLSNGYKGEALTNEVKRRVDIEMDTYEKMEEADGQGYLTFDAYRSLRYLENDWSDKQEALFQKIIQGKDVDMSDITEFFPVYKLQNFGHLANTGLPVNSMHKFALMPLIPSVIKGSDLESLHHQMLKSGTQYATFQTGSKVASITKDGKPDQIYEDEEEQKNLKSDIEFTPNVVYLEYLKNVTAVPNKYKGKTVFSTQLRKLILEGLYEQGIINNPNVAGAAQAYEKAVDDYTDILKTQLLEEIGYEYKNGKYIGNLGDFLQVVRNELGRRALPEHHIKFVNVNEDNTVKTDLSLHLEADEIEKILVSLIEKRLVKQKVKGEALVQVSSGMSNKLWNQGSKFTGATDEEVRKYLGSNNLPFYNNEEGNTSAMKVAIALQGDFQNLFKVKHPDNNLIEVLNEDGSLNFDASLDRLNEAIKDEDWLNTGNNRKSVTLTAVRIPVQGLNSMEFMEVHHFLNPAAGNIIIPPSEIVAKSGADFDVDKLTTFMPSINENGEFRINDTKFTNKSLKTLIDNIKKSDDPKKREQILRLIEERKKVLENNLITSIRSILELPENYANLVRPNGTYLLKDIADDLESDVVDYNKFENEHKEGDRFVTDKKGKAKKVISPTRVLEVGYNLHKHDVNMVGKAGLGIVAIENSLSPVFNALGAKMPLTYKPVYFDEGRQRYVEDKYGKNMEMRLRLNHNTTPQGNISLSNVLNAEGDAVSDLYSQMMNGLVDVEKDAWVFFIQGNTQVIPVLTYLIKAGVPKNEAINFVSQPLVREYVKQQKILGSVYGKLSGQAPQAESYIKYEASNLAISKLVNSEISQPIYNAVNVVNIKNTADDLIDTQKYQLKYLIKKDGELVELSKVMTGTAIKEGIDNALSKGNKGINHIKAIRQYDGDLQKYINLYTPASSLTTNNNYYTAASLANTGTFDSQDMRNRLAGGYPIDLKSLDMFLHFIEIEKQIKGIQALKREANPDTKTSKTIQEIVERTVALEDLSDLSKIDPALVDKLRNESILNSFFDNQIVLDLLEPLFKLRNNKKINDYVTYAISAYASSITKKYGKGQDGVRQFINEYKNSVVNYIFQNYMTNMVNAQGQVVNIPEIYRGSEVVNTKAELTNGILFQNNTFYINEAAIRKQFTDKTYLDSSASTESYKNVGLTPFRDQDDPFDTFSSYLRFVMEREFVKNKFPQVSMTPKTGWLKSRDYGTFLNQRALINSFNQKAIVGTEGYSFTKLVQSVIQEYPHLKDKYPVLLQLSEANLRGTEKILTLSNKALAKGDLAESYNLNLEDLANPNVQKAIDKDDVETNNYISEVFKILPIMSIYQNGVGYSKYGINKVLPYDQFLLVIENASINFINRNLNLNTFDTIFESLFKGKEYFKNYVQNPLEFNSTSNTNKLAKEEVLSVPILEIDLQEKPKETPVGTVIEFDTTTDEVEPSGMVRNRLSDVLGEEPSEAFLMKLYQNYVNLMGRNKERAASATPYKNFVGYVKNSNVIKYKDTYIFGTFEPRMNVFVSNMSSSPSSKELLAETIPYISKQFDVIGFAPKDVTDKYKRSGYQVSNATFNYNFKGENMDKYMYASNPGISMRLFGKPIEEVTSDEIKKISERGLAISAYKVIWTQLTKFEENADIDMLRDNLNDLKVPPHIIYNVIRNLDSWLNQSRESLNEAIKAMEARGEVYNKRNPPKRKLIKKYLRKNLAKLYDFSKVDIDPIGTNALNRIVPETENELNKLLVNYLASFGIKFEYTDIKEKLGMDTLAVADILNKIAYVQKDNSEDLPNIAGKFIAFMLQHNPLVTETYEALRKQSRYRTASKDEILNVIGELISEQLHKKTNTEMPKSLIDKIKLIIDYLFNVINKVRVQKINKNIGVIVDGVLTRNKALITAGKYKPGAEGKAVVPVSLQDALDSDPFASAVVDKMAEHFMLGGSTTASEQGTIYRPNENQVHDLDWVSFLTRAKGKEVFESMFPNSIYVREILDEEGGLSTDTWLIAPEGYTIENVKFQGSRRKVIDYDIVDSKGKVVSKYIANTDTHTGKIGAKAIDIFSYDEVTPEKTKYKEMELKSGITLRISDWRNTFAAKLSYGRLKDIWDYNRYIPNEYVESTEADISDKFVDMGEYQKVFGEDGTTADRKMRGLADGALVESIESFSPAQTTLRVVQKKIKDLLPEDLKSGVITQTKGRARLVAPLDNIQSPVIMLSRNYSLKDRPLDAPVKQALDVYMSKNAKFIFGNSSTDRPFLEYLLSKKYDNFTVYALTAKGKDKIITVDELFPETVEAEETKTFEQSDSDILKTVEFSNFFNSEILKNPELKIEEILEYYKKCKLGQ